jgi:hypothetical protein
MNRSTLVGAVMALAVVSAIVFFGVAGHELNYANAHPYAYGPAKVIAWGAAAGGLLSIAVGILGYALRVSWEELKARDEQERLAQRERIERARLSREQRERERAAQIEELRRQSGERSKASIERARLATERLEQSLERSEQLEREFLEAVAASQNWELRVEPAEDGWGAAFVERDASGSDIVVGSVQASSREEAMFGLTELVELPDHR